MRRVLHFVAASLIHSMSRGVTETETVWGRGAVGREAAKQSGVNCEFGLRCCFYCCCHLPVASRTVAREGGMWQQGTKNSLSLSLSLTLSTSFNGLWGRQVVDTWRQQQLAGDSWAAFAISDLCVRVCMACGMRHGGKLLPTPQCQLKLHMDRHDSKWLALRTLQAKRFN